MNGQYAQLATVIGEVCLNWAYLETIVHDMALHLAAYKDRAYDNEKVMHPLHVALSHMKLRERIFVVKALAHEVKTPADYYERLTKLLSIIDNDLTIERNRYVHDIWQIDNGRIVRFSPGPKVVKSQSRQRELVMGSETAFANLDEVSAFLIRLSDATNSLIDLENELAGLMIEQEKQLQ